MRKKIERTTALLLCLLMAAVWLLPAALASATPTDLPEPAPEQPIEQAESTDPEAPTEEQSEDVANECSAPETDDLLPDENPAHESAGEAPADELTEEENLPADIETPAETSTEPELDDTQTEPDASAQAETETTDDTGNSEEPEPSEKTELTEDEIVETQFGGSWIRYAISKDGYAVIVNNRPLTLYTNNGLSGDATALVDYAGAVFTATAYHTGETKDSVQVWYLSETDEVLSGWAKADAFRNHAMTADEIAGCKISLVNGEMNHGGQSLPVFLVVTAGAEPDAATEETDASEQPVLPEQIEPSEQSDQLAGETEIDIEEGIPENSEVANADDSELPTPEAKLPDTTEEAQSEDAADPTDDASAEDVAESELAETDDTADEAVEEIVETEPVLTATVKAAPASNLPWTLIEHETAAFDTGMPNTNIDLLDEDGTMLTSAWSDDTGHVVFDSEHTVDGKDYYSRAVYSLGGYEYSVAVEAARSHHSLGEEGEWGAIQTCVQAITAYLKKAGLDLGVQSYIRDALSRLRVMGAHVHSAGSWKIDQAHIGDIVLPADDGGHVMMVVAIDYTAKMLQCATICHSNNWHQDVYGNDINWAWITVKDAKSLYKLVEEVNKTYTYRVSEDQVDPRKGQIRVIKKDSASGQPIAGVIFDIYQGETVVGSMTTGTNGIAVSDSLSAGEYTVREREVPAGYMNNPAVLPCTVEPVKTVELVALNAPIRGSVRIVKTDSVTGEPLARAVFTVTCLSTSGVESTPAPGTVVATLTTNAQGIAVTGELPCGEYRIDETGIPDGYLDIGYTTTVQIK